MEEEVAISANQKTVVMVSAVNYPNLGGTETHVFETSKRLAQRGYNVINLTTDSGGTLSKHETVENIEILRFSAYPSRPDLYYSPALIKTIRTLKSDIIHIQGVHTLIAPMAIKAAKSINAPVVLTFHSGGHSSFLRNHFRSIQYNAIKKRLRQVDKLVGVSNFEARFFSKYVGAKEITVIPNGADHLNIGIDMSNQRPNSGSPKLITVGRLEKYKGQRKVIKLLPHLIKDFPNIHLYVVGRGPDLDFLTRLTNDLKLTEHVTFTSFNPSERHLLTALIKDSDAFLLLSDYEAHPVAVIEAVSLGVPAVVLNDTGLSDLVSDGFATAVEKYMTPSQIATIVASTIKNSQPISKDFKMPTWNDAVNELDKLYNNIS